MSLVRQGAAFGDSVPPLIATGNDQFTALPETRLGCSKIIILITKVLKWLYFTFTRADKLYLRNANRLLLQSSTCITEQ